MIKRDTQLLRSEAQLFGTKRTFARFFHKLAGLQTGLIKPARTSLTTLRNMATTLLPRRWVGRLLPEHTLLSMLPMWMARSGLPPTRMPWIKKLEIECLL